MTPSPPEAPLRILHPTDCSWPSQYAFAHALRLALALSACELRIVHVTGSPHQPEPDTWWKLPQVRPTLRRWGLPYHSLEELGLRLAVTKSIWTGSDPLTALRADVEDRPADLIVLATHTRGASRWRRRAIAGPLARSTGALTLFVPGGTPGFVSTVDGLTRLERILIPVASSPAAGIAVEVAARVAASLADGPVQCVLLQVGAERISLGELPSRDKIYWHEMVVPTGSPGAEIRRVAAELSSDLLVMATAGRAGILDSLVGSTTERVVRDAPCPVLTIPTSSDPLRVFPPWSLGRHDRMTAVRP